MPCDGPSKKYSDLCAKAAFEEIIQLLREKYQVTPSNYCGIIRYIASNCEVDYKLEEQKIKKALEEIFYLEACANW